MSQARNYDRKNSHTPYQGAVVQREDFPNFGPKNKFIQRTPRVFLQPNPRRSFSLQTPIPAKIPSASSQTPSASDKESENLMSKISSRIEEEPVYTGPLKEGLPHGFGIQRWPDGSSFQGTFSEGKRHGNGAVYFVDEGTFEGQWQNDQIVQGIHIYLSSSAYKTYIGQFLNWRPHGYGCLTFKDQSTYEGQFDNGYFQGYGVLITSKFTYEGEWINGRKDGWGILSKPNATYQGYWKVGVRHGLGFSTEEKSSYQGYWENGKKSGYGVEEYSFDSTPSNQDPETEFIQESRKEGYWQKDQLIRKI